MKRRFFAITVALMLILSVAGCAKEPLPTGSGGNGTEGGWINASFNNADNALSDTGCYHMVDSYFLYYVEIKSGIDICLCSKPGCLHDKNPDPTMLSECDAYIGGADRPFFWDEHIYFFVNDEYGTHIYSRDETGLSEKKIGSLGTRFTEEKKSVNVSYTVNVGGKLYYEATVDSIQYNEDRQESEVVQELFYIGCMNLTTGKDETIIESTYPTNLVAAGETGVIAYAYDTTGIDFEDPDYRAELEKRKSQLMLWNAETRDTEILVDKTYKDFNGVGCVSGTRVFCSTKYGENWYYDLKTGETVPFVQGSVQYIGSRYALLSSGEKWKMLDLQTGQELQNELNAYSFDSYAASNTGFVLLYRIHNGEGKPLDRYYCFVAYEDLADGLQKKDLTPLYSEINNIPNTNP